MMNQAKRQVRSYKYAAKGVRYTLKTQVNIWVHLAGAVVVLAMAAYFGFSLEQYLILLLVIGLVIAAELFNTAIELMTDLLSPQFNDKAGAVKDVAAGGVLMAAVVAVVVGFLLFWPHVWNLLTA